MQASLTIANLSSSAAGHANPPAGEALPTHAVAATVESSDLLRGQKAVSIVHNGSVYRLQSTKLGKLILTK